LGRRYSFLTAMITVLITTVSWQLMDECIVPSATFFDKLLVATATFLVAWFSIRLLLGKREEGVHL